MELIDKDLQSVQEVRNLIREAKKAQHILASFSQEKIDRICDAVATAAYDNRVKLAKMARDETGFGIWEDKVIKNAFASKTINNYMKGMKTVGLLSENVEQKTMEIAVPVGVIAGLIPSTNPTSTAIYKALISIKAGNAIVFSPHPNALKSILEAVRIISEAAVKAGAPEGTVSAMTVLTMQGTHELMTNQDTNLILATGGSAMVKAAYSSGTPAIGVGPGNGPSFIERSANIPVAVRHIMDSKTFDNGTICSSEQSIVVEQDKREEVIHELKKQGAYFMTKEEADQLSSFILRANGTMNPQIVGKSPQQIGELAKISVPNDARVLIAEESHVGKKYPYSREKLAPILAFYTVNNWQEACDLCMEVLFNEGAGHTMTLHTENKDVINEFAMKKPVSRLLVNTPGTLGGLGATTNLVPALTLGCGSVGGSSTSDNIGPKNLFNIRRVAFGVRELSDIRAEENQDSPVSSSSISNEMIESLVAQVISRLQ